MFRLKISKFACLIAVYLAECAVAPVMAQERQRQAIQPQELPPSPLEAFATRSTAKVILLKPIGRFESRKSNATLAVVILEDQTTTAKVMRGLRIDLAHNGATPACDWRYTAWQIMCQRANAAVYVEEARLVEVRNRIAQGAAELRPGEFISEYAGTNSAGLIICGYEFPDRGPSELADLFTRAIGELRPTSR